MMCDVRFERVKVVFFLDYRSCLIIVSRGFLSQRATKGSVTHCQCGSMPQIAKLRRFLAVFGAGLAICWPIHRDSTFPCLQSNHRLVGLVVRRPPRERKIPGSNPACARIFSGSSHTSDSKIGTPVATLPGAWHSALGLVGPVSVYYGWVR